MTPPVAKPACRIEITPLQNSSRKRDESADDQIVSAQVHPDDLVVGYASLRSHIDHQGLESLKASISVNGIIEPLVVRRTRVGLELVCGHRRHAAAVALGLQLVPIVVRDIPDGEIVVVALHENIHRDEMNPLDEAKGYRRLFESGRVKNQTVLAKILGISQARVSQMLGILELSEPVQELFITPVINGGKPLTEWHARALRHLDNPEEQFRFAQRAVADRLSGTELANLIRERQRRVPKSRARQDWTTLGGSRYRRVRQGVNAEIRGRTPAELLESAREFIRDLETALRSEM